MQMANEHTRRGWTPAAISVSSQNHSPIRSLLSKRKGTGARKAVGTAEPWVLWVSVKQWHRCARQCKGTADRCTRSACASALRARPPMAEHRDWDRHPPETARLTAAKQWTQPKCPQTEA